MIFPQNHGHSVKPHAAARRSRERGTRDRSVGAFDYSIFDVFENLFLRLLTCRKAFSMDGLDLQAVVPALHGRIVIAVAFLAHAGNEAIGLQKTPIVMRAVLAATVGVEDNPAGPLAPPERHTQGIAGEFGRHPFGHD